MLAMLSTAWFATGSHGPGSGGTDDLRRDGVGSLRRRALARRRGPGRTTRTRRVEVVDGLVLAGGTPVSGAELRARLGADAALVLKLSYLTNAELKDCSRRRPPRRRHDRLGRLRAPGGSHAAREGPPAAAADAQPPRPARVDPESSRTYRRTGARLGLGKSVTVDEDEDVTAGVVAIFGNVTIAGRVSDERGRGRGQRRLTPTAEVRGDITRSVGR